MQRLSADTVCPISIIEKSGGNEDYQEPDKTDPEGHRRRYFIVGFRQQVTGAQIKKASRKEGQ
jgi:hypothetical protein